MRRKLVAANWKMNMTLAEASAAVESFLRFVQGLDGVDVVICPPYLALDCVRHLLRRTDIRLGAQDVFWKETGAFTGQVSAKMLADLACRFCLVGHSETRGRFGKLEVPETTLAYFSETDETVNLKICSLLFQSIQPILCVGETLEERETGRTDEVISAQLEGALRDVDSAEFREGVVAYEPVWAIGTGQTCDTPEAERVCAMIRSTLTQMYGDESAQAIRILYGGSVKSSNAKELFRQQNIDGGLIGGASLNPEEFSRIVRAAI